MNDFPLHYFHLFYLPADSLEPAFYLVLALSCMRQLSAHFNVMSFISDVAASNFKFCEQKQSVASALHETFAKTSD